MKSKTFFTSSPEQTEEIGATLCADLVARGLTHAFVALYGEMGVGKTAFARGFGRFLGAERVKSPTYTIVSEHRGNPVPLFHFDMYRIGDADELTGIGFDDYLARPGYILCEWSENIPEYIPSDVITVRICRTNETNGREIHIGGWEA